MKKLIAMIALAAAGCSPKFGLFGPKMVDLLDPERCVVAVATTNRLSSSWLAAEELTNYIAKVTGKVVGVEWWRGGEVEKCGEKVERWSGGEVEKCGEKVERWSGGEVERCGNSSTSALRHHSTIVIGTLADLGDAAPEEARRVLAATDNFEAAWTGVRDGKLWIVGKDETAELYATYHFLEKQLDIRWFRGARADDPGEYVPDLRKVETWKRGEVEWCGGRLLIPEGYAEFREPKFVMRRLDKSCLSCNYIAWAGGAWAVRNGFQVNPGYHHKIPYDDPNDDFTRFFAPRVARRILSLGAEHLTYTESVRGDIYKKDHPEYFPLINGKRICNAQYCLSNTNVARILAADIIRRFDETGGLGRFNFGQVDSSTGYCECENCRALDAPTETAVKRFDISRRFNFSVAEACKIVWAKYPNADLRSSAYDTFIYYPYGMTFDPRMKIQYCWAGRCYGHDIDDPGCVRNAGALRGLKTWLANVNYVDVYDYFTCTPALYACRELSEAHDLRVYASLGVKGWKNEWMFPDGQFAGAIAKDETRQDWTRSNWQWINVVGKLLWDPSLDEQAILDDIESKYYGAAYPAMKKYHALRRALWENDTRACMGYPWEDPRRKTLLAVPGAKEKLLGLLDEAEKLSTSALYLTRIADDRRCLVKYWIEAQSTNAVPADVALRPPLLRHPLKIDGTGENPVWCGAPSVTNLCGMPAELATSFAFQRDASNIYVLVRAKEPEKLRAGDGVAISLRPPVAATNVWRFAVTWSGGAVERSGGAEVPVSCLTSSPEGWVLEMAIPAAEICPLRRGDIWLVGCERIRPRRTNDPTAWRTSYTADGEPADDPCGFRPLVLDGSYLSNGSLTARKVNRPDRLDKWSDGTGRLVPSGGIALPGETGGPSYLYSPFIESVSPRTYRWAVMACGDGILEVRHSISDGTPKGKCKFLGFKKDAQIKLDGTLRYYEGRVTLNPFERGGFSVGSKAKSGILKWVNVIPE